MRTSPSRKVNKMSSIHVLVFSFVSTLVHSSQLSRASTCITSQGTPCIFPFKARGVSYSKCTHAGGFTRPWCATATDTNGNIVLGSWGDCPATPNCVSSKTTSSSSQTTKASCLTISGAQAGAPCVFPFIARGVEYSSCTYAGGYATPWCATKVDARGNNVLGNWGDCPKTKACLSPAGGIEAQNPCNIGPGEQIGELHDSDIDEASGLAVSQSQPGILWTFNDHGEKVARVFAIGETGEKLVTFELEGAINDDWEDIAIHQMEGGSAIYVADTGNNKWDKEILTIYKFPEPKVNEADIGSTITIPASQISHYQIHWPAFSYDCEALAVEPETGDIYLFTKDRENSISEVYRYPAPQNTEEVFTLEHVTTLQRFWITGADISPDGRILALTNKQEAFAWQKEEGESWAEHLLMNPQPCVLSLEEEEQREAIAVSDTGYWTVSECKQCPIWFYPRNV